MVGGGKGGSDKRTEGEQGDNETERSTKGNKKWHGTNGLLNRPIIEHASRAIRMAKWVCPSVDGDTHPITKIMSDGAHLSTCFVWQEERESSNTSLREGASVNEHLVKQSIGLLLLRGFVFLL